METVELFNREYGTGGDTLVIIHGLYGSSDNWVSMARLLAKDHHVFVVDQRNHGHSPHTNEHSYNAMVADLHHFFLTHNIARANLLGHSMGGKTAMLFALQHPEMVHKLIVADISPRAYSTATNYGEITNNHQLIVEALVELDLDNAQSRTELEQQLGNKIPAPTLRHFLLKNIERHHHGHFFWRLNLPVISQSMEEIMDGFSELNESISTETTTIFVKGELSPYTREEDLLTMRKRFKGAQMVTIPKAGHWLHAEQPDLFYKTIRYFLED